MQSEIDWRHYLAAAGVVLVLVAGGWKMLSRGPEAPNAPANAGANARKQDAPEALAPGASSPQGVNPGLPQ